MQDIEKYIFDPNEPHKCKVYNGLVNALSDSYESATFISPTFYFQLFEKKIFTPAIVNKLWDKPENFNELSGQEKVDVFIQNYSLKELIGNNLDQKPLQQLFHKYISLKKTNEVFDLNYTELESKLNWGESIINFNNNTYNITIDKLFNSNKDVENKHLIFFIDFLHHWNLIDGLKSNIASFVIANLTDYEEFVRMTEMKNPILNFKPLFLTDIKHANLLVDLLTEDVSKKRKPTVYKTQSEEASLSSIHISNYFCVKDLTLDHLSKSKEIYLLGENGDGKSLVLQGILLGLKGETKNGDLLNYLKDNKGKITIEAVDTKKKEYKFDSEGDSSNVFDNVFAYGVHRSRNDSDMADKEGFLTLFYDDAYLYNPEKWLQYLYMKELAAEKNESTAPTVSLELEKKLLVELLDHNVQIEVTADEVVFIERGTRLQLKQLSEGYKSVITWTADLLKRLSDNQPEVRQLSDYTGVVLVDEIDLYLHPKWAYRIINDLRQKFTGLQFIVTTHNPVTVLGASKDAVFYKVYKEDGETKVNGPITDISELMANSLITSPLFGLPSSSVRSHDDTKGVSSDDYVYHKIHQVLAEKIKSDPALKDDAITKMVEEELAKLDPK